MLDLAKAINIDVICFTGAMVKCHNKEFPVSQFNIAGSRFSALQWGFQPGQMTNKSCGITFLIGPRLRKSIVAIHSPPNRLAGRVAGLRVRTTTMDMLLIGVYMPVKADQADMRRQPCVRAILAWISQLLDAAPLRTVPFVLGDLNAKFGYESGQEVYTDEYVGFNKSGGAESTTSRALRERAEHYDMRFENTF